jgi:hypothetical protein
LHVSIQRKRYRFEQLVKFSLDPFSQHKTMLSREPTRVVATPQNQVVRLGDDYEFFLFLHAASVVVANGRPNRKTAKMAGRIFFLRRKPPSAGKR